MFVLRTERLSESVNIEVGPLKTTHHIAWPVIVYAPLGALCMEAFLELLPIMVPASIFTSVVMQAVFWRVRFAPKTKCVYF